MGHAGVAEGVREPLHVFVEGGEGEVAAGARRGRSGDDFRGDPGGAGDLLGPERVVGGVEGEDHERGFSSGGGGSEVLIGLGANVGDPRTQLRAAIQGICGIVHVVAVSSLYRTEPVGGPRQPDFFNLVVLARSRIPPARLLAALLAVERTMGRVRGASNAPRTIDIDLLAVGDTVIDAPHLVLPHPRMHLRGFVLVPLLEVAPGWRHPILGTTAAGMLNAAGTLERVEPCGRL